MRTHPALRFLVLMTFATLSFAACGDDDPVRPVPDTRAPDFTLADANVSSPTFGDAISVRQQTGKVSAWYFGHST